MDGINNDMILNENIEEIYALNLSKKKSIVLKSLSRNKTYLKELLVCINSKWLQQHEFRSAKK